MSVWALRKDSTINLSFHDLLTMIEIPVGDIYDGMENPGRFLPRHVKST